VLRSDFSVWKGVGARTPSERSGGEVAAWGETTKETGAAGQSWWQTAGEPRRGPTALA